MHLWLRRKGPFIGITAHLTLINHDREKHSYQRNILFPTRGKHSVNFTINIGPWVILSLIVFERCDFNDTYRCLRTYERTFDQIFFSKGFPLLPLNVPTYCYEDSEESKDSNPDSDENVSRRVHSLIAQFFFLAP